MLVGAPEWRHLVCPPQCCVERPDDEMGRRAAQMLLAKAADPEHCEPRAVLPVSLREGRSVRPNRAAAKGSAVSGTEG